MFYSILLLTFPITVFLQLQINYCPQPEYLDNNYLLPFQFQSQNLEAMLTLTIPGPFPGVGTQKKENRL